MGGPENSLIREDLLDFLECNTGITGQCLADKITSCLQSYGLDLTKLRGQAYDGAGNVAGTVRGTAALITSQYPLALYTRCTSHCLNMAVVKSLRNMMGVIEKVYQFFAVHPKRQRAFEHAIAETQPSSKVQKLKDLCRTRWVQRIDALQVFQSLHLSVVTCMETICNDGPRSWTPESLTDARSLQLSITTTEFISALVITAACLNYLRPLTCNLQSEAKDIVDAVKEINSLICTLQNIREHIDSHHSTWFREIEKMCTKVGTEACIPRRCGRQIHRSNFPSETPSEYFRCCISVPLLDHLISEMSSRFSQHQQTALLGMAIVPTVVVTLSADEYCSKLRPLADMYHDDLPSPDCLESEFHCWHIKWHQHQTEHGHNSLPSTIAETLRNVSAMYPNIQVLASILGTLPVTTCSAERSFSSLKRVKISTRSTMTNDRLSGISLLHVHRDIPIDISAAIDEFCRQHPRRLELANILQD